ncbi:MAG: hypothetical protein SFU27_11710 [Thermonemataceae bacterium]|nr:hypothetical protein [Thermonemataceae bacterium]
MPKIYALLFALGIVTACKKSDNPQPTTSPTLNTTTTITDNAGNTYSVGYEQVSSNNKDPFVLKKDANGNQLWKYNHESTSVDGTAYLVILDNNAQPWVVFSVDGGSNDADYISKKWVETNAFSNVFMNSYGNGGGPKVAVLAQLDANTGKILKGTFLTARKDDGKTNTFTIKSIGTNNGNIAFEAETTAWPFSTGSSYAKIPNITDADRIDGVFKVYYEIKNDLSEIVVATLKKP